MPCLGSMKFIIRKDLVLYIAGNCQSSYIKATAAAVIFHLRISNNAELKDI